MRLPPYGKKQLDTPGELGPWICCGPEAWHAAKDGSYPRMVMPRDASPKDFNWPVAGKCVTVTEHGINDVPAIQCVARELIAHHGAKAVIARRSVGGLMIFTPESKVDG